MSSDFYIDFQEKLIHISNFVRRQTPESSLSHWTLTDQELRDRIIANFDKKKQGYRDGVWLVPVEPEGFFTSIVELKEGDLFEGSYRARKEGEEPRQEIHVIRDKSPAVSCDIVLYSHEVLAEKNENETDCLFEVVSVNAVPSHEPQEIPVGTLIANHLELSGGTATKMTDSEFVAQLRKSVLYWKGKSHCAPRNNSG